MHMAEIENFLDIRYEGNRFAGGRLPLDVLADLQALQDILTTFAREIWLKENDRERMPNGYAEWFRMSIVGIDAGSAVPRLELSVVEDPQQNGMAVDLRSSLMERAEQEFGRVLKAASDGQRVALSATQIRNFNRFLTDLKPGELFTYRSRRPPGITGEESVISLDVERRKRFLTSVTTTYEQRIQGRARLKSVDENSTLRFFNSELREFQLADNSREPTEYGSTIGSYYEFDLTVERRHDDSIQSVVTIHDLALLENPAISAVEKMAILADGWLEGRGKAVPHSVRAAAIEFISSNNWLPVFYAVAPTEEGGILLESELDGWDYGIEFHSDGSRSFFGIELKGKHEFCDVFSGGDVKQFFDRVKSAFARR